MDEHTIQVGSNFGRGQEIELTRYDDGSVYIIVRSAELMEGTASFSPPDEDLAKLEEFFNQAGRSRSQHKGQIEI